MRKVIYAQADSRYSDLQASSLPYDTYYTLASFDTMLEHLSLTKCAKAQAMLAVEDGYQAVAFTVDSLQGYLEVIHSSLVRVKTAQSESARLMQAMHRMQYSHEAKLAAIQRLLKAVDSKSIK